jgi:hypothetical protein
MLVRFHRTRIFLAETPRHCTKLRYAKSVKCYIANFLSSEIGALQKKITLVMIIMTFTVAGSRFYHVTICTRYISEYVSNSTRLSVELYKHIIYIYFILYVCIVYVSNATGCIPQR